MLLPKRVKYRRVHRGRMTGKAMRGNTVSQGDFGIVALEPSWITSNQIEAARIAMTRYIKRGGKVWIKIFPDKPAARHPNGRWLPLPRVLGGRGKARPRSVRDRGRERGDRARGPAPCRTQAARQVQVCET